jgi:hypothetical protein
MVIDCGGGASKLADTWLSINRSWSKIQNTATEIGFPTLIPNKFVAVAKDKIERIHFENSNRMTIHFKESSSMGGIDGEPIIASAEALTKLCAEIKSINPSVQIDFKNSDLSPNAVRCFLWRWHTPFTAAFGLFTLVVSFKQLGVIL